MNNISFPVSIIIWREMISFHEFRGLGSLLEVPIIFIICLPFFLLVFMFRNILIFKYTFHPDRIIQHYILGFHKTISKSQIIHIIIKNHDSMMEIHWRTRKFSSTNIMVVFKKSISSLPFSLNDLVNELKNIYSNETI